MESYEKLGNQVWKDLHIIANYEQNNAAKYMKILQRHYPCEECRKSLMLKVMPCENESMEIYFYNLHNIVNIELKKDYHEEDVLRQYKNKPREDYSSIGTKGIPENYIKRLNDLTPQLKIKSVYHNACKK